MIDIKHFVKLVRYKHYREEHQLVVLEGQKLIEDVSKKMPIEQLISTKDVKLEAKNKEIVPHYVIQRISSSRNPQPILATVKLPKRKKLSSVKHLLVLDNIQDPGNLGTLLRTAYALGWDGVFYYGDCADPFNDKALRAAQGATFFLPYNKGTAADLQALKTQVLVADLGGEMPKKSPVKPVSLVLGNEGQGVSDELKSLGEKITIPMENGVDSLNVNSAGSILMYVLTHG